MDITCTAGADLSAKQFYFVKLSADDTVVVCAAATDIPIGVLQNKPTSGQAALVRVIGKTKVSADAALTYGQLIGTSGDGQADPKTAGSDTTEYICGRVLNGVANANELASAMVDCASPSRAS